MGEDVKVSKVEQLKESSNYLRGTIKEALANDSTHFSGDESTLLKTHGTYQQDDRDLRQALLKEKKEPAYSMMVRSRIPGGKLTWEQYVVHDDLASKYGNQTMRLTTRQGVQFHGVLKKNLKALMSELNRSSVTTAGACGDVVRNVMSCPAPFSNPVRKQVQEYAKAVSDQFLSRGGAYCEVWLDGQKVDVLPETNPADPEPIYGKVYLPRKFKITMTVDHDNCTDIYDHDIGIVAETNGNNLLGFNILVGGGLGMTHGIATTFPRLATPLCFVKPEELLDITKAIVLVQRDFGNRADRKRARMKYLVAEKGIDWFREEVEKRFGKRTQSPHEVKFEAVHNHLGWHDQGDGKWFLGLYIENGRVKDEGEFKLKTALRKVAEQFKPDMRITAQQDLLIAGIPENKKAELENFLKSHGVKLPTELSTLRKDAMACPALPTCGLAITESERFLPSVIDELEKVMSDLGLENQRILTRMTGCPNGCARPYNAEIAFVGRTVGTYNVYLGGSHKGDRMAALIQEKVPQKELSQRLKTVLTDYKQNAATGEHFGDYCSRMGVPKIKDLFATAVTV